MQQPRALAHTYIHGCGLNIEDVSVVSAQELRKLKPRKYFSKGIGSISTNLA